MPLRRKHQIAAKLETSEGTDPWGASTPPATGDFLTVFEPDVADSVELNERQVAGASLSRGFDSVGRATRSVTFRSDLVGDTTSAATVPPWDALIRASGFRAQAMNESSGTVANGPFYIGERVGDSDWGAGTPTNWGLAVNKATGAGATLYVIPIAGTWDASVTAVYGEQSGATIATATTPGTSTEGVAYLPDSTKTLSLDITAGGWSGGTPSAGDVLVIKDGTTGEQKGSAFLVSGTDPLVVSLFYGSVADDDTLHEPGGGSATLESSNAVTIVSSPSIGLYSNLDSLERRALGCRGEFTVGGEVGQVLEFNWTFQGSSVDADDSVQVTGATSDTLQGPRFQGAVLGVGYDRDQDGNGYFQDCFPIKSVEFAPGNTLEDRRAPCSATGLQGATITDRDPTITLEVEQVGTAAFNWFSAQRNAWPVSIGFYIGTEVGNRVGMIAENCQVTEVTDSEADGLATHNVTLRCRRIQESGDDEVAIFKF
jgi:hypothetical protein